MILKTSKYKLNYKKQSLISAKLKGININMKENKNLDSKLQ